MNDEEKRARIVRQQEMWEYMKANPPKRKTDAQKDNPVFQMYELVLEQEEFIAAQNDELAELRHRLEIETLRAEAAIVAWREATK